MYYDYYFKREQYQDQIRESEKERIIRKIQDSNREKNPGSDGKESREGSSWISRIGWAIREARGISPN